MSSFSASLSKTACQTADGSVEADPSVMDGYDPDLVLAQHLIHDCDKPTFWALSVLAAHGQL